MFKLLFLVFSTKISVLMCCHTFNYTRVVAVPKVGEKFDTLVTGCLQRTSFDTAIKGIYVENAVLPTLESDAVRHLRKLTHISFRNCQIQSIERNLFRNVPRLKCVEVKSNNISEISAGIFTNLEQLEVLRLNDDNISAIQKNAFGNLSTLKEVDCSGNRLETFSEEWFGSSANVEVIRFEYNRIRILEKKALSNFHELKVISFSYNLLEIIEDGVFAHLTSLDYLGLRYNKLVTIDPRIFPNEFYIKTFKIGANYLNFLPTRIMAKIIVKELEVWGNPWKCPCLEQVFYWLYENNATVKTLNFCKRENAPFCAYPSSYSYACIETIDEGTTYVYLKKLKGMNPPLDGYCARLDDFVDERRKRNYS